jgi:Na+-transporting NADH:ubiquinone oxidoreductase subunit C
MSAFENQFLGMAIEDSDTNFGINQGGKNLLEGSHNVDGISGATQTSMAVIRMMNEGASDVKRNAFKSKIQ